MVIVVMAIFVVFLPPTLKNGMWIFDYFKKYECLLKRLKLMLIST